MYQIECSIYEAYDYYYFFTLQMYVVFNDKLEFNSSQIFWDIIGLGTWVPVFWKLLLDWKDTIIKSQDNNFY